MTDAAEHAIIDPGSNPLTSKYFVINRANSLADLVAANTRSCYTLALRDLFHGRKIVA
jgi:hypothetical protein